MSAARLAAESAFAGSRYAAASEPQPVVTVRRSRGRGPEAADAQTARGPAAQAGAGKGPRVFRLDGASSSAAPGSAAVAPAAAAPLDPAEAQQAIRRKRRLAAEQRPGPVVQIFRAPAAADAPAAAAAAAAVALAHGNGVTREQLAALADMLADVQPVLEDIRRARDFRVVDRQAAAQWQLLADAAAGIRRQIRSLSPPRSAALF